MQELVQLLLGPFLLVAVALLELAGQLVALAVDGRQVAVGQLAPLLLDLARELLPVARDLIPVHRSSSFKKPPAHVGPAAGCTLTLSPCKWGAGRPAQRSLSEAARWRAC